MIGRRVVYKRPARIKIKSFQVHSKVILSNSVLRFSQYNRFIIYQSFTMQQKYLSLTASTSSMTGPSVYAPIVLFFQTVFARPSFTNKMFLQK